MAAQDYEGWSATLKNIYDSSVAAAERYGLGYNLVAGANLAGVEKVANAMIKQGRAL